MGGVVGLDCSEHSVLFGGLLSTHVRVVAMSLPVHMLVALLSSSLAV